MCFVGIVNISLTILVVFESRYFRKKLLLTFLITHFQQIRVLKTYFIIYEEFDLIIKLLSFNDRIKEAQAV